MFSRVALACFGVKFNMLEHSVEVELAKWKHARVFLDEASVMGTENVIMAAALCDGESEIYNAACEPHVQGLCRFLEKLGVQISGIGTNRLIIQGGIKNKSATHSIMTDHIEVGSIIALGALMGEGIKITNCANLDMGLISQYFTRLGIQFKQNKKFVHVPKNQPLKVINDMDQSIPKIDDAPWPGFPADLTSIAVIAATQAKGTIMIHEKMFESRLFWVDKLITMGARAVLCDPHRVIVAGPAKLKGSKMNSPDIRAGMALLIAALCADGVSEIVVSKFYCLH